MPIKMDFKNACINVCINIYTHNSKTILYINYLLRYLELLLKKIGLKTKNDFK